MSVRGLLLSMVRTLDRWNWVILGFTDYLTVFEIIQAKEKGNQNAIQKYKNWGRNAVKSAFTI